MRLDDLQGEGGRNACVEGVAAALEHPHADRGRDPVGARDNAEGSLDFGPCREQARVNEAHGAQNSISVSRKVLPLA
jgi:hypothetical protein